MKLHHYFITLGLSLLSLTAAQAAAPLNDSALKATEFKGNYKQIQFQDLNLATAAATDPLINGSVAGKSLWYKLPRTTNQPSATWSVSISEVTGSGVACLFEMLDESNPLTGIKQVGMSQALTAGQTAALTASIGTRSHLLMIAGTGKCDVTHRLSDATAANDFLINAQVVTGERGTVQGNNSTATVSEDEPGVNGLLVANTVWYVWTPSFTGAAAVDTNFSFRNGMPQNDQTFLPEVHRTTIAVFEEPSPGGLGLVGSDEESGWDANSRLAFNAVAGTKYYIAVSSGGMGHPGQFQLNYYRANTGGEIYFNDSDLGSSTESRPSHQCKVFRRYAGNGTATVKFVTNTTGTATAGADFTSVNQTLSFTSVSGALDSAWLASPSVNLINDTSAETFIESVGVELNTVSGATLGAVSSGSFRVYDDETSGSVTPNGFRLDSRKVRVSESDSVASNTLFRITSAGSATDIIMSVGDSNGATEGEDFTLISSFIGATDAYAPLYVSIKNNSVFEPDRSFEVVVINSPLLSFDVTIEDDDPYLPIAGRLNTSLTYNYSARTARCFATITGTGAVTGKLFLVGQTLPFKSQIDVRGKSVIPLAPVGRPSMMLTIQATDAYGSFTVTLNDGLTNSSNSSNTILQNYAPVVNPCPELGRYTLTSDGASPIDAVTAATITVDVRGNAVIAGKAFDGAAFIALGYVNGYGRLDAVASLYVNQGCIAFSCLPPLSAGQVAGVSINITRPARAGDAAQLGAFRVTSAGTICRYSAPTSGQRALGTWSTGTGKATLTGGAWLTMFTKTLTISKTNVIAAPVDAQKLKLALNPVTGIFTGSVILPGTTKILPIYGALIDLPNASGYGQGFFFNGLRGGKIVIGAP